MGQKASSIQLQLSDNDNEQSSLRKSIIKQVHDLKSKAKKWEDSLTNNQHLIIFIHGFNNTELQMNDRSAYLDQQLGTDKVITTDFNWESCCSLSLEKYREDQKTATKIAEYFAFYLEEIRKEDDIHTFKQVDIFAHSMGNHILVNSILNCYENKKLNLFKDSNIIAVAPDVKKTDYVSAAGYLADAKCPIVSKWIHFWNKWDKALLLSASKFANSSVRAGAVDINIDGQYFESFEWDQGMFSHGYIGQILDKDCKFKTVILETLKLGSSEDDSKENDTQRMSRIWNAMHDNLQYINRGGINTDNWWKNLNSCSKSYDSYDSCGTIKLQEHAGGTEGLIGFVRSVGWWSNHNHKYRIIWKHKENCKWKELYHSDDFSVTTKKYNEYVEILKWKENIFKQGLE